MPFSENWENFLVKERLRDFQHNCCVNHPMCLPKGKQLMSTLYNFQNKNVEFGVFEEKLAVFRYFTAVKILIFPLNLSATLEFLEIGIFLPKVLKRECRQKRNPMDRQKRRK